MLFFAEAVTLAHVARPVTLAQSLDPNQYDVHLAWHDRYAKLFPGLAITTHAIGSIEPQRFMRLLARGTPIYSTADMRRYVQDDLRVIDAVKPDLIVGDFRLSLSISAMSRRIPYAALANAYWSPFASRRSYPMPDHPLNKLVGRRIGGWLFNLFRPIAFARYAAPVNKLRREHGLPSLGSDLRHVYTHGDHTLYCDAPAMAQLGTLPPHHHFIGPVTWSPRSPLPRWWDALPGDRPVIYVNLGSSGDARRLPAIIHAAQSLDVTTIIATAGAAVDVPVSNRVFISDFLPGDAACARADLVICNGGSPTTQQAFTAGKPVIGVPGNLDQHLNMAEVTRLGAGVTVLSEHCKSPRLTQTIERALKDEALKANAKRLAVEFEKHNSDRLFPAFVEETVTALRASR